MRRGYTIAQYDGIVAAYLEAFPDGALTADVLVGFPGEDESDFGALVEYLESRPFAHLHVFPYSPRPGTAAARLSDRVPDAVLQGRMERVLAIGQRQEHAFRERAVGRVVNVLVEEALGGEVRGTTDHYLTVRFPGGDDQVGRIVPVEVLGVAGDGVVGRPVG